MCNNNHNEETLNGRVEYVEGKIGNSTDSKELLSIMNDEIKALKAALIELQKLNTSL